MRCRWVLAVATVAMALWTRAAGGHHSHLGGGSLHHHRHNGSFGFGYAPFWVGPWWYSGWGGNLGYYGPGYYGTPQVMAPGAAFGPMIPFRFPGPVAPVPNVPRQPKQARGAVAGGAKPPKRKTRVSNASALARAKEYLKFGDGHFRTQKFSDAYQRYKKAASAAPDVAEAHFRQGFSLLALGKYESASSAFLRGLELKPDWAKSRFRLDELYGANRLAKANQLEQLAVAASDQPGNSRLMFLVGVELFFDGQGERARKFFVRASDLGENQAHLSGFFKALGPARNAERLAPKRNGRMEL